MEALVNTKPRRFSENGHAVSGAVRDEARRTITAAVTAAGRQKCELSPAQAAGASGWVRHYAVGDLYADQADPTVRPEHAIVAIDTDYYVSSPDKIFGWNNPAILHTFNPVAVAGLDADSRFRIRDNIVEYEVGGGGLWKHAVWDWCGAGEYVQFNCQDVEWWQIPLRYIGIRKKVYHKIHHARPWVDCPHRVFVWLVPQYTALVVNRWPTDLRARELERVSYADVERPGWNVLAHTNDEGDIMQSIGRQGADAEVTLKKTDVDVLLGLQSGGSVTTRMLAMGYKDPKDLALFGQFYRGGTEQLSEPHRILRSSKPSVHWPLSSLADFPETSARTYAAPLVTDECMVPMIKRWETLSLSLDRRVDFVANTRKPSRQLMGYADEFVCMVVPEAGVGHPLSFEEAREELDKPTQVQAVKAIWETIDAKPRALIEAFVKNEPTTKHGRIISSFPDVRYLIAFSRFTLAFRDQILHTDANKHWFLPGSTPPQVAERLQDYALSVTDLTEGDYSNFDGSVSAWLQVHVMNAVYLRWFAPRYAHELRGYTSMLVSCPARAKRFGFRYDAGVGVKSGSPTTCDLNTVLNAFLQYAAIRRTRPMLPKEQAFASIGLAFGDDSVFESQYSKAWAKVAESVGMVLKVETVKPDTGVCFLARVFPDINTTLTSFQDPLRTWRKLHLTMREPCVPLADAAVDRVEGYLVTDSLTPVTSNYCRMVQRVLDCASAEQRRQRKSHNREKPYWLFAEGTWPQDLDDTNRMLSCMSARTGFSEEALLALASSLDKLTDPWAVTPLNTDEVATTWVDTLDKDCQPTAVDTRQLQHDSERIQSDAGFPEPSDARGGPVKGGDATARRPPGPEHPEGHSELPEVPLQPVGQSLPVDGRPTEQAARGRGAPWGGRRGWAGRRSGRGRGSAQTTRQVRDAGSAGRGHRGR